MTATASPINLLDLDQHGLRAFFESIGEQPFRAQQLLKWVYHQGVTDFTAMTNLGLELRQKLQQLARIEPPRILGEQLSADGTTKWLMGFGGGNAVETVFIPEPNRGTLCISSQVGCALNCTFCSTGAQGFSRNLTTAEINQLVDKGLKEFYLRPSQIWRIAGGISTWGDVKSKFYGFLKFLDYTGGSK